MSKSFVDLLGKIRSPAEPGPGPIPLATLRALDLAIGRRIEAVLAGDYRSTFAGIGTDLNQIRLYSPGDDVRRIDWSVTARTGQTHVRIDLAERMLLTWLVVDKSASMAFGTTERRKVDVAEGVCIAVGHLASRRGNRLGVATFGDGPPKVFRPRHGRDGLLLALDVTRDGPSGKGGLGDALKLVNGLAAQRSLVVIVSDFREVTDWRHALLRIAARHQTYAVEIRDPREQRLTDIGDIRLLDPETGQQVFVDTSDRSVRDDFATMAEAERDQLRATLASAGVPHVALSTDGDWLLPLAMFLSRGGVR